jgi:hypothetical protein
MTPKYDAMCCAIDTAHAADEIEQCEDLATLVRVILDEEPERRLRAIRRRAEREAKKLIREVYRKTAE